MKKLYALVVCLLLCVSLPARAESYVLDDAGEREFSTISSTEYDINGEAGVLTFEGGISTIFFVGNSSNCYLDQYVDGAWIRVAELNMLTQDWQSLTYTLDRRATKIKMYTETGAVGNKHFRNVKVTRARYIEAEKINLSSFTSGSGADDIKTQRFSLRYSKRCRTPHRFVEQFRFYGVDRSDGYRAGRYDGRCYRYLCPFRFGPARCDDNRYRWYRIFHASRGGSLRPDQYRGR